MSLINPIQKYKRPKSPKKQKSGLVENKCPLSKYTNYHSLTAPLDHIYAMTDRGLYKSPEPMKGDRARRDIKQNCAFYKDIGHTTDRCIALKEEIERLIRAGHFKECINEPSMATREERPWQQNPEKVPKVLTIIGGSYLAGESHNTHYKYTKDAKTPPLVQVHRTEQQLTK